MAKRKKNPSNSSRSSFMGKFQQTNPPLRPEIREQTRTSPGAIRQKSEPSLQRSFYRSSAIHPKMLMRILWFKL